ncbi:MAG: leucine-rich repeat domain-containing protein [Paludibacteraceae bacterium]|nr:leucine-rich repeat domain-containing protein [Paludibacteraceae bacterium]
MKKFLLTFTCLVAATAWAQTMITYTATGSISIQATNFTPNFTNHRFNNGIGSITFPSPVTLIGEDAFVDCTTLTSISLPASVTYIGESAFSNCCSLSSVTGGEGVQVIDFGAFIGCNSLQVVELPESVKIIGEAAFANTTGIQTVKLPAGLDSIGAGAFSVCTGITSITCAATVPPRCGEYCFYEVNKTIPVYVPAESITAYQSANEWKDFTNIQAMNTALPALPYEGKAGIGASKFIRNGQLLIKHNDKIFNAIGGRVR